MTQTLNAYKSSEKYIEVRKGVKLHITDRGTGKPIVLIPGLPMSDEIFELTYDVLVENGYRAIGITLRGFGKSDSASYYDKDLHAQDLDAVLYLLMKRT